MIYISWRRIEADKSVTVGLETLNLEVNQPTEEEAFELLSELAMAVVHEHMVSHTYVPIEVLPCEPLPADTQFVIFSTPWTGMIALYNELILNDYSLAEIQMRMSSSSPMFRLPLPDLWESTIH